MSPATDALALADSVAERLRERPDVVRIASLRGLMSATDPDAGKRTSRGEPLVMVAPAAEQPARSTATDEDGAGQSVTSTVHVYCVVASRNVRGGGDAIAKLRPLRAAVRSALAGWIPDGATVPMRYAGGRLADPASWLGEGLSAWQDAYVVSGWLPAE